MKEKDSKGRQTNLDSVLWSSQESFARYTEAREVKIKRRRNHEVEAYVIRRLSEGSVDTRQLWFELYEYRDIREEILTKLRHLGIVKVSWGVNPNGALEGIYSLNMQEDRARRILGL